MRDDVKHQLLPFDRSVIHPNFGSTIIYRRWAGIGMVL